jgi:hypothetical protein
MRLAPPQASDVLHRGRELRHYRCFFFDHMGMKYVSASCVCYSLLNLSPDLLQANQSCEAIQNDFIVKGQQHKQEQCGH